MNAPASITITPVRVADLLAEGERMPVYVHVIDHPDARVLVDTGLTELHPAVADLDPRLRPLSKQDFDLAGITFARFPSWSQGSPSSDRQGWADIPVAPGPAPKGLRTQPQAIEEPSGARWAGD